MGEAYMRNCLVIVKPRISEDQHVIAIKNLSYRHRSIFPIYYRTCYELMSAIGLNFS